MALKRIKRSEEELRDLGFGSRVTESSRLRLLNRDGSFNVRRDGLPFLQSIHLYHSLLTMSWLKFYLTIMTVYIFINALFALVYVFAGVSIAGATSVTIYGRFLEAFFFSVQTFTTVGYGRLAPLGVLGNILASFDAFVGLISFAIATPCFVPGQRVYPPSRHKSRSPFCFDEHNKSDFVLDLNPTYLPIFVPNVHTAFHKEYQKSHAC